MILTIGKVAKSAKVNIETIRYYEKQGLIPKPPRNTSGYRQYPEDTIARIRFIKSAQELGFSLKEISELLALKVDPHTTCADVKQRAENKASEIDQKIKTLKKIKNTLSKLAKECNGKGPTSKCPILDSLGVDDYKENNANI
ncbi:MAG TPA: MerR family transcriptional regulator [Actinobacteria bacterium]|nr:MerR family transcriptional regulator [Actinomycetota bacterium]